MRRVSPLAALAIVTLLVATLHPATPFALPSSVVRPLTAARVATTGASSGIGFSARHLSATLPVTAAVVGVALAAAGASALIVQNKGGGHGELGYHLALNLAKQKGIKVTMITDSAAKKDKPPFNSYSDLEAAGVQVRWADLANGGLAAALQGVAPCDYVFDNQNVCTQQVQSTVVGWKPKAYVYVSSGGMYKPVGGGPLLETGSVKEENEQLGNERNAAKVGLSWSAFRPQYIYGPKTNKRDYIDWFLDRIVRDLPIPIPGQGYYTTTLTNAEDVASMLASVVGKEEAAKGQVFNCATDVLISHNELVTLVAKTVGKNPQAVMKTIVYYDPAALKGKELPKKGKFPFRETHFGVSVQKAKDTLGWLPKHKIEDDLFWYYQEYKRLGKDKGSIDRDWDQAVISAVTSAA